MKLNWFTISLIIINECKSGGWLGKMFTFSWINNIAPDCHSSTSMILVQCKEKKSKWYSINLLWLLDGLMLVILQMWIGTMKKMMEMLPNFLIAFKTFFILWSNGKGWIYASICPHWKWFELNPARLTREHQNLAENVSFGSGDEIFNVGFNRSG